MSLFCCCHHCSHSAAVRRLHTAMLPLPQCQVTCQSLRCRLQVSSCCHLTSVPVPAHKQAKNFVHSVLTYRSVQGVLVDVELNQRMTGVCRNSVRAFVEDRTDKDGRVSIKALNKFSQMTGFGAQEPWNDVLKVLPHPLSPSPLFHPYFVLIGFIQQRKCCVPRCSQQDLCRIFRASFAPCAYYGFLFSLLSSGMYVL